MSESADRLRQKRHVAYRVLEVLGREGRPYDRREVFSMLGRQAHSGANCFLAVLLIVGFSAASQAKDDWEPIPPDELALKDDPLNPGAPAIILYRETFSDHEKSFETHHYRIKILNERGAEYGNVQVPYVKGVFRVEDIKARTVQTDGTSIPFDGRVYEKTLVKVRKLKAFAKTFSLPAVEAGSIVEYKYKLQGKKSRLFAPPWIIQTELSVRRGRFAIKPYSSLHVRHAMFGLLEREHLEPHVDGTLSLGVESIPAFLQEDFMPPEDTLKVHVRFFYAPSWNFWSDVGRREFKRVEKLIGKDKSIKRAVSATVSSSDDPQTKLRKLYGRAQQIRNLSYESSGDEQGPGENAKPKDVLVRGSGSGAQINRLFVALARAAGLDASIALVATRDRTFFRRDVLDADQLNAHVVTVRLGSEDIYLDPATPYTPFGLLSWEQTGVEGIVLRNPIGGLVTTPDPVSADARTERKATLRLTPDGTLEGKGHVAFHGQEALQHRLRAFEKDDLARREQLEEELKGWLPAEATVEVDSVQHWENPEEPLRVEFTVEAAGFASAAGRRLLVPAGVLRGIRRPNFQHAKRVHPVYFPHPWEEDDEIILRVPAGYEVEGMPEPRRSSAPFGQYEVSCEKHPDGVLLRRRMAVGGVYYDVPYYAALRQFFNEVKAGDEQQLVLVRTEARERQQ